MEVLPSPLRSPVDSRRRGLVVRSGRHTEYNSQHLDIDIVSVQPVERYFPRDPYGHW